MSIEIVGAEYAVEVVVGFFAWIIANWAYLDFRRNGTRGFKRIAAFIIGWPTTFVTMLVVGEEKRPPIKDDDEGLDRLVKEIRRDRLVREGWNEEALGSGQRGSPGDAASS